LVITTWVVDCTRVLTGFRYACKFGRAVTVHSALWLFADNRLSTKDKSISFKGRTAFTSLLMVKGRADSTLGTWAFLAQWKTFLSD